MESLNSTLNILELTKENFETEVKNHKKILVDFWASWCSPCSILSAIIAGFKEDFPECCIAKYCIEEDTTIPEEYNISSIPTVLLFQDGVLKKRNTGIMSIEELEAFYYEEE